jgi:protein phosphatase PTC7
MIPPSISCRACSSACSSLQAIARDCVYSVSANSSTYSSSCSRTPNVRLSFHTARVRPDTRLSLNLTGHSSRRAFHSTPTNPFEKPSPSKISYRVAVSSSGKGRRFHPIQNAYNFDPNADALGVSKDKNPISRRRNRPDSGEDAFFVSRIGNRISDHQDNNAEAVAFGVADGVGGWTESRVDPADFSHGLCGYMAQTAQTWHEPAERLRPKHLLQAGYDQVVADSTIRAGGSTASVGVALPDGRVELANLGDSGSVLIRRAAVHHYSVPQTHGFNTPYQLSVIPPRMRAQASVFGGAFLEDFPRDASVTNVQMQHGDVLIVATDGVFDNINNQDILKLITSRMIMTGAWTATDSGVMVSKNLRALAAPGGLVDALPTSSGAPPPQKDPADNESRPEDQVTLQSVLAATVAGEAKMASVDYRRDGPFAKEAQRYYPGDYYRGGKVDDICVVVVIAIDDGIAAGDQV